MDRMTSHTASQDALHELSASDYACYRVGFPERTFQTLAQHGIGATNDRILDFGLGTGTLARGFAVRGCAVTALEQTPEQIAAAKNIAEFEGLDIEWVLGRAEQTCLPGNQYDAVTAGQCWHWFDRPRVAQEVYRVLKPGGQLAIIHFDWLNIPGSVAEASEQLIDAFNPLSAKPHLKYGNGVGIYPAWTIDVTQAGFEYIQTFSFDVVVPYTPQAWRGRVRAHQALSGKMTTEQILRFDLALKGLLEIKYNDEMLEIPHRVWGLVCVKT